MRVLIAGVGGASGRAVSRLMLAAGHDVVGLTEDPHPYLDPRIDMLVGSLEDVPIWTQALSGVDVVIHLADAGLECFAQAAATRRKHIRIVVPVADGRHIEALDALANSLVQTLIVRTAPLVGRRADAAALRSLAGLLRSQDDGPWPVLHHDDLDRYLFHAATAPTIGEITLAAPGSVPRSFARELLTASGNRLDLSRLPAAERLSLEPTSHADFACGWTGPEAVEDLIRGLGGRVRRGVDMVEKRGRFALPTEVIPPDLPPRDGGELVPGGPPEFQGEFDTLLDPRFPVLTCTNTSEALPRPLTPMTLDLQVGAIRVANAVMGEMLALEGVALEQQTNLVIGVLGHTPYINASVGLNVVENMPGWDEETVRRDVYGHIPQEVVFRPQGGPPMPSGLAGHWATLVATRRTIGRARKFKEEAQRLHTAARREMLTAPEVAAFPDAALHTRALLSRDRLAHAWSVTSIGAMLYGAAGAVHARGKHPEELRVDVRQLESARTMLAVEDLAAELRGDDTLIALAQAGDVDSLCAASGQFASLLKANLDLMGHRGPGECELANPTFADRPSALVMSAASAAQGEPHGRSPVPPVRSRTARMAIGATLARELARDAVVRYTRSLRLLVRERGRRLAEAGVLDQPTDVYYLTLDEAFALPADVKTRVRRRSAERDRLMAIRMPDVVVGSWEPAARGEQLATGAVISGLGVFPGVVEGRVRVLQSPDDDIEPGDILVAAVTDVGHTAMFGYAGAVVTDIGGTASHAAIVAREFGIPCVVDTKHATTQLPDGAWVSVDGAAGTVTLLALAVESEAGDLAPAPAG